MRIYAAALLFFLSFNSSSGFAKEAVATFMKQSLDIDLASLQFGSTLPTNGGFGRVQPPTSAQMRWGVMSGIPFNLYWMTNADCAKYQQKFKNRSLIYAIRDGKLIAIHVTLVKLAFSKEQDELQQKELQKILDELIEASPFHVANMDDGVLKLGCAVSRLNSELFSIELEITPSERPKQSRHPITSP